MRRITPPYVSTANLFFAITLLFLGIFFRLYLLDTQLISDDEWHAVFRVADLTLWQAFTSFGHADHSIPMVLYDKFISTFTPLNEFWLRLPSVLAGLIFLALLPLHVLAHTKNQKIALFLLALVACSPFLIQYARLARPYALSLLCSYLAHIYFHRYWQTPKLSNLLGYAIPATISTWALAISGFFVIAPFFYILPELYRTLRNDKPAFFIAFKKAFIIGAIYSLLTLAVILPPLIYSFQELAVKSGTHLPTRETYQNVWFVWFGTWSNTVVIILLVLALIGAPSAWRRLRIYRTAIIGCLLVLLSIYATKPAWILHPLTFGRYMLAGPPVLFISVAFGLNTITSRITHDSVIIATITAICTSVILTSQLPTYATYPSGHRMMGYYMMDPRPAHNLIRQKQDTQPHSDFWVNTPFKPDATIALAPFYFISYDWQGVIAEKLSQRRVIPAFYNGFCTVGNVIGEPSYHQHLAGRIQLRNGIYLAQFANKQTLTNKAELDWFVWQKALNRPETNYVNAEPCEQHIDAFFGIPDYEDDYIKAYKLKN